MASEVLVRVGSGRSSVDYKGHVVGVGDEAEAAFQKAAESAPIALLLAGDRSYAVTLSAEPEDRVALLRAREGRTARVVFPGRSAVRRRIAKVAVRESLPTETAALDLTEGRAGAAPLWLLGDGTFSTIADGPTPGEGLARFTALITAARWISSRRTSSFERLFAPSAFHPDMPLRPERLSADQGRTLLSHLDEALSEAAVDGEAARADAVAAAQIRSAAATVLSHLIATSLRDATFRGIADEAAARLFVLVDAEHGSDTARPALRAHVIGLLQMRAPALSAADKARAKTLLSSLVRAAPPYADLKGPWNFAMCSASEFHEGECDILVKKFKCKEVELPSDAPAPPQSWSHYKVFEAPIKNPHGEPIRFFARSAQPRDENYEMGQAFFVGLLINRHAQLGSFDMRAATVNVKQQGYKLMMNSQCAGLTTRFAIGRLFPDADIYSSWDSTYFRKGFSGESVVASEGIDCFFAIVEGMAKGESHKALDARSRRAQWHHDQADAYPDYSQFVGPANPLVVGRYSDVNQDGRADFYDGFLDFYLSAIAEDLQASMTPKDPGVAPSQVSGEAANGLGWAAGSMNRVTQYSDIWAGLPGQSEMLYAYEAAGFFSHDEPPKDVATPPADTRTLGKLPAVVRYTLTKDEVGLSAEVMYNSWLSHAAKELKRLMVSADAMQRAIDLGILTGDKLMSTRAGQRGALLLTLAGELEFPADQNFIDGLWGMALKALNMPDISRSVVRACITEADHDMSNYYGSRRGLKQLLETLEKSDPIAHARLASDDMMVGRASELPGL